MTIKQKPPKCYGMVHNSGRSVGFHPCNRTGRYEYKGLLYCKTHHPPNVEAKQKSRLNKWQKEYEAKSRVHTLQQHARNAASTVVQAAKRLVNNPTNDPASLKELDKAVRHLANVEKLLHDALQHFRKLTGKVIQ